MLLLDIQVAVLNEIEVLTKILPKQVGTICKLILCSICGSELKKANFCLIQSRHIWELLKNR